MSRSQQLIRRINEVKMKRPVDYYLHHYWRELSDEEREALEGEPQWELPIWLDSPVRGDWRDWDDNASKYKGILDREIRKQLGKLIDWPGGSKDDVYDISNVEYHLMRLTKFKCVSWDKASGIKLVKKWQSLLNKDKLFRDADGHVYSKGFSHVINANFFGKKWNKENISKGRGHQIITNFFSADLFRMSPEEDSIDGVLGIHIGLGPFYNIRVLKLDEAIPRAIKTIKQMIPEILKEAGFKDQKTG